MVRNNHIHAQLCSVSDLIGRRNTVVHCNDQPSALLGNSLDSKYWSDSPTPQQSVTAQRVPLHGLPYSGSFTVAPMSAVFYKRKVTPRKTGIKAD